MTVKEAMRIWQSLITFDDESCCNSSHEYYDKNSKLSPKQDHLVCDREMAWRRYVRLRDNDPHFPFNRKWLT